MINLNKIIGLIIISLSSIFFAGCALPFTNSASAGLKVESDSAANVYIDNQHVGNTPFMGEKIKPGDHLVKLISLVDPNQTYETKINLKPNTVILIYHDFAPTPQESSTYILDLEKINSKDKSQITLITTPPNVVVRLDDQPKGFTPILNLEVNPGQHKLTLNAQGYATLDILTEVPVGFRLVVTAELGKVYPLKPTESTPSATESAQISPTPQPTATPSPSATPTPTPTPSSSPSPQASPGPTLSPSIPPKPYVEILSTPTGWLRVRSEPNGLADNEVAKVYPGKYYPFLESNQSGWYKIEYEPGKQGWIAAQYAKLVE